MCGIISIYLFEKTSIKPIFVNGIYHRQMISFSRSNLEGMLFLQDGATPHFVNEGIHLLNKN